MQSWSTSLLKSTHYRPRQFEYHPTIPGRVVFGTLQGEAVVADVGRDELVSVLSSGVARDKRDSILGLCWLRRQPSRFVVGSSHGYLRLCNAESAMEGVGCILREFDTFEKLTSVHVNATDDYMLVSGYSFSVQLFDLETGSVVREFRDIHSDHINISRFAHSSPFLFATSSFDRTVKTWDARMRMDRRPIYSCSSQKGHVMLCFSADDSLLLTSAVDNEVTQYLTVDGRRHLSLDIPKTGLEDNFTRSYYTADGRHILSGSSEEQVVRVHCAQTGALVQETEMYPGRKHNSLYIQSLRGDPHCRSQFSVLVNYRDSAYPLEIIHVNMSAGADTEEAPSPVTQMLADDLWTGNVSSDMTDCDVLTCEGAGFPAHSAMLSCRCPAMAKILKQQSAVSTNARATMQQPAPFSGQALGVIEAQGVSSRITIPLPSAVRAVVLPVILQYIYTDELCKRAVAEASRTVCRNCQCASKLDLGQDDVERAHLVRIHQILLEASQALHLPRLSSLLEWECRSLVDNLTVVSLVDMARKCGAQQLLGFCMSFLVTHFDMVLALHGEHVDQEVRDEVLRMRGQCTFMLSAGMGRNVGGSPEGRRGRSLSDASDSSGSSDIAISGMDDDTEDDEWGEGSAMSRTREDRAVLADRLVPTMTGHTANAMLEGGQYMVILGGGNKRQFHSCRHILVLNPASGTWSKHTAQGSAPSTLIYHTSTPLEAPEEGPRRLLVFGGSNQGSFSTGDPRLWILDALTMTWSSAVAKGTGPSQRTRHTIVALHGKEGRGRGAFVKDPCRTYLHDASEDTNLILFAGYNPVAREAFNGVFILNVHKKMREGGCEGTLSAGDNTPYDYCWFSPTVLGTPPAPRLAHASCLIGDRMVVFGGVGLGVIFNDTHVLNCGALTTVTWEEVTVQGTPPSQRYGHSLVSVPSKADDGIGRIVLFGGTSGQESSGDVFVLTVVEAAPEMGSVAPLRLSWSQVELASVPPPLSPSTAEQHSWTRNQVPCPRSRQTLCEMGGKLILFGGSDEVPSRSLSQPNRSREVDTCVYELNPDFSAHHLVLFESDDMGTDAVERQLLTWSFRRLHTRMLVAGSEPSVIITPSHMRTDMQRLLVSGLQADIVVRSGDGASFPAHKFVLASRCEPLRAMLSSGMIETTSKGVTLSNVSGSVLWSFLVYLYTDMLELSVPEDVMELMVVANQYTNDHLVALCEGYLKRVIDVDNAPELLSYAHALGMQNLKLLVTSFVLGHWQQVTQTSAYHSMASELKVDLDIYRRTSSHVHALDHPDHALFREGSGQKMAKFVYAKLSRIAACQDPDLSVDSLSVDGFVSDTDADASPRAW